MLRMRDIMTADPAPVSPETTLRGAMELLMRHRVSGAPVLAAGKLRGIVSSSDLIDFAVSNRGRNGFDEHTVGEIMTRDPVTVEADDSVCRAAELMRRDGIHRILVVEDGRVVGIASALDVVSAVAERWGGAGGVASCIAGAAGGAFERGWPNASDPAADASRATA